MMGVEFGLRIEQIPLARAPIHEELNDSPRAGRAGRKTRGEGIDARPALDRLDGG
jgi:hypothetical protein